MKILAMTVVMIASSSVFSQQTFDIKNASKFFNIQVKVAQCDDLSCSGKVRFALFSKGAVKPFQIIFLKETQISLDDNGKPEIAFVKDKKNGKWSSVYFEDFNFDGLEDLAVADGDNGGYSSTSYRIYIFNRNRKRFVFNSSFTRLAQGPYIGIPETNKKDRTLYAFWKSGCCMHYSDTYLVSRPNPKLIEGISEYDNLKGDGYIEIETRKLIHGKWRTWNKRKKIEPN